MQVSQTEIGVMPGIQKDAGADVWPLSAAQHGVWVGQQLDPANPRYNCGGYLVIHGPVNVPLFQRTITMAIAETEALRLQFAEEGITVLQMLGPMPEDGLKFVDFKEDSSPQEAAEAWMRADLARPVDLRIGPLFLHVLFQIAENCFLFYIRYHHIVMDGFGQIVYWHRVADIYSALAKETEVSRAFGPLEAVLTEENSYRTSAQFSRDREHWLQKFAGQPEPVRLSRGAFVPSRSLLRRTARLGPAETGKMIAAANHAGTRWSVIAIAATAVYLHRLTCAEDIVLGLPLAARLTPAARATPCMLANELPLRLAVRRDCSLRELVYQVREQVGQMLVHQRYRGEWLHQELRSSGNEGQLFGPVVNVVSFDREIYFAGHATTPCYLSSGPVRDLLIGFYGSSDGSGLQIYFDANPELYSPQDIAAHQQRFLRLCQAIVPDALDLPVSRIDLLSSEERRDLTTKYNGAHRPYDLSRPLHELIDDQAERTPDAIAAATGSGSMTYRELRGHSGRLAAHLRAVGVASGQFVGVYEERSLELVVDLLAILKAGAAYVPLDPELPLPRLEFQLQDAGIRTVLTCSALLGKLARCPVEALAVDELLPRLPDAAKVNSSTSPESAAYAIYTSGSTGQPKGVVVPHKGVVNRLLWMQEEYQLVPEDCILQKTPFTFDVSVWEFFWPLLTGSRLFLAAPGAHRDPRYLAKTIREQAVTSVHFVPPMLDLFLAAPEAATGTLLRRVFCSGEALPSNTVQTFLHLLPKVELHNLYGPTEASIDVTYWRCGPDDAFGQVPIGRAVANTQIYLLDAYGELAPAGVPGELYIGGVQVASGYINRPDLTRERFVPNPFGPGTLYRTGDLACYRKDGVIEFLGRLDHQVKLRGFRIELGEIEAVLRRHSSVEQAVVAIWERSSGDRRLVAYVVPDASAVPEQQELAGFIAGQLPEYMVPAHIMVVDSFPLLSNGKINRRALPEPEVLSAGPATPPSTPQEQLLHDAWREVLGFHEFGIDDSFFGLGGDSMLSIRSRAYLEKRGWSFEIHDLFHFPTVRTLAKHLHLLEDQGQRGQPTQAFSMVRPEDRARLPQGLVDAYPLSAMQGGMLFQAELDADSSVYRVVTSLHIAAELNSQALRQSIAETLRRHPALRVSFDLVHYSEALQLVHSAVDVPLEEAEDLGDLDEHAQHTVVQEWMERAKFHRFDSAKPPLLAFAVHRRGATSFQLSAVEHHVVLDGWSDVVMFEEILVRYRARLSGEELWLPELPSTYRDFVAEERRALRDEKSRLFWSTLLEGVSPAPLPRTALIPGRSAAAQHQAFDVPIPIETGDKLRQLASRESIPLKSLLIAAHMAVLRTVCGSDEVVTGTIFNGRLAEEGGDEAIGVFLNTLPLRIEIQDASAVSVAHRVFSQEQEAARHGRYPFIQIQQERAGQFQLDSYVNFMDFHQRWHLHRSGTGVILEAAGIANTNFPLAVNFLVDPVRGSLRLWLDCDISVLGPEFCAQLAGYYQRALGLIASSPEAPVASLDLLDQQEKGRIASWNITSTNYDRSATVQELIERQVRLTPNAVALAHRLRSLSYAEMEQRANQLAHLLRELGIGRGNLAGVHLVRGPNLVIALLAVLKAGAAYVPLDPGFPKGRLEFIASDAGIHVLITEQHGTDVTTTAHIVRMDVDAARIAAQPVTLLDSGCHGDGPAYVMYTSGSTGLPKGTVVRQRNLVNFFAGMNERIGCTARDVLLAVTSVSFDISVLELLWPLTCGAKVVIAAEKLVQNIGRSQEATAGSLFGGNQEADSDHSLVELCEQHGVTMFQSTPSFLTAVVGESEALECLAKTRALLVGGELFPLGLAERLLSALSGVRIFNMYGPTETTVWSMVHELDGSDIGNGVIPIGRPIANTQAFVLDAARQMVPIGVDGELWIGGEGVAAGYLGRPELTAERFVQNGTDTERRYRTGDRVRWRTDGLLEFRGRIDRQVKILGHRVEPDEVESVLSRHPRVASVAVVAAPKGTGSVELVAYVSPANQAAGSESQQAQEAHVKHWSEVWERAYTEVESGSGGESPDSDFAGWVSSYTGEPIPVEDMQEWLRHTISRILSLAPRSVVDVGVGMGLVLRELAPRVEEYLGIDISSTVLRNAAASISNHPAVASRVAFVQGDARQLARLKTASADTVVLNSVVQYFPGADYLEAVIREAARVAGDSGAVFIGDVRSLDLLEAFHADVQLYRAAPLAPASEITEAAARQVAAEREFCLSPAFFHDLASRISSIGGARIELKRGYARNELTCFRYDVTLLGSQRETEYASARHVSWAELPVGTLAGLSQVLTQMPSASALKITGIPNSRLVRSLSLLRFLGEAAAATAWDMERLLWEADDPRAVCPEDLAEVAGRFGRPVELMVPAHGRFHEFEAVFGAEMKSRK